MRKWIPWAAFLAVVVAVMLSIPTTVDPIVTRTVADVPLPPSPPCPPGSDCAQTYPCSTQTTPSAEFETRWTAVGNNRMMSSPHATDLNGDSVLDIVVGTGAEESHSGSIIAVDGATGSLLWEMETDGEMFASAQFEDLDGDNVDDIALGGRDQQMLAVNGATGETLWSFDKTSTLREAWYQFYSGQFIDDVNDDGVSDWLVANGGDPMKQPDEERDTGYLMILSGANGQTLGIADLPDGRETYMSPLLYTPHPDMATEVIYGSGGETWDGSLWSTSIDAIMDGDISASVQIVAPTPDVKKGFMTPPAIADLTLDGIQDIVVSSFDGRLILVDGRNYTHTWSIDMHAVVENGSTPGLESWASPTVGYFTSDSVPDVFVNYVIGIFPQYSSSYYALVDGASGEIIWNETTSHTIFTSPLSVDLDSNGRDDVVIVRGVEEWREEGPLSYNTASILDTCEMNTIPLYNRTNLSIGTPLIADLDMDGDLEMVATTTTGYLSETEGWTLMRMDLNVSTPSRIGWGAYMGSQYDGEFLS